MSFVIKKITQNKPKYIILVFKYKKSFVLHVVKIKLKSKIFICLKYLHITDVIALYCMKLVQVKLL